MFYKVNLFLFVSLILDVFRVLNVLLSFSFELFRHIYISF